MRIFQVNLVLSDTSDEEDVDSIRKGVEAIFAHSPWYDKSEEPILASVSEVVRDEEQEEELAS